MTWIIKNGDYPLLEGVSSAYEYYNNYNLPYSRKYKLDYNINDGYPFIFRLVSGWAIAYPYAKNNVWVNSLSYIKIKGTWQKCNTMMYDEKQALYQTPKIKTGWRFVQGLNDGYPFVVHDEIPFYEEGGLNSGNE